jgi:superoxide reductase
MQKFKCKVCGYVYDPAANNSVPFENLPEDWKCPICGAAKSEFEPLHQKGEPQTGGEAQEKHVPVIENKDGKVLVKIGTIPHPMTPEHHIVWVELRDGDKQLGKKDVSQSAEPAALFDNIEYKDGLKAYAFCNLHGVWES